MTISKEYIRHRLSVSATNAENTKAEYIVKDSIKLKIYKLYTRTPILYKHRKKIKSAILSIPFMRNFLVRHKQKILSAPILKDIIALFR